MAIKIIGAGLAGMLAANTAFQDSEIIEKQTKDQFKKHTALLRFRSPAVGDALGIDFKPVTVHKAIWHHGDLLDKPDIRLANMYSQKTNGSIQDRSIWNLETTKRWVAPDDLHERLIDRCKDRIQWGSDFELDFSNLPADQNLISTIPFPLMMKALGTVTKQEFKSRRISVLRYRIQRCNVHQTIYFPDMNIAVYRASITGDILTLECVGDNIDHETIETVCRAFCVDPGSIIQMDTNSQEFGKILPIDESCRKTFLFELTHFYNIYSLGRFATWRQILLDDVLKDIFVIKKMIGCSSYDISKAKSK